MKYQTYPQQNMTTVRKTAQLTRSNLRFAKTLAMMLNVISFSMADIAQADNLTLYSTGFEQPVFQPNGRLLDVIKLQTT